MGAIQPAICLCSGFQEVCGMTAPGTTPAVEVELAVPGVVPWACASALAKLVGVLDAPAAAVPLRVAPIAAALAAPEEPMGEASCCCAWAMTPIRESTASILILLSHRRLGGELKSAAWAAEPGARGRCCRGGEAR